ncbi:hypothetical protein [Streptomyces sp. NPDC048188]|uniref:hypothetical protein n=1 Tax=Streptomyces sp. NPDC048188 TaxID=3155749 RepID=UPI0034340E54
MTSDAYSLAGLSFVFALAVGWCLGYRARARGIDRRQALHAEQTARPPGPHPAAVADEIALGWQALAETCCLRAWESGEHDPASCTRKDQPT